MDQSFSAVFVDLIIDIRYFSPFFGPELHWSDNPGILGQDLKKVNPAAVLENDLWTLHIFHRMW